MSTDIWKKEKRRRKNIVQPRDTISRLGYEHDRRVGIREYDDINLLSMIPILATRLSSITIYSKISSKMLAENKMELSPNTTIRSDDITSSQTFNFICYEINFNVPS